MESHVLEHILDGREEPTNLPLALLKKITNNFSEEREIGHGGFATVYKGVLPKENVAVKRIRNSHTIDEKLFYREVNSLLTISHPNVVRFLGFCASTDQTAIKVEGKREHIYAEIRERLLCFEYISNGNLQKHITDELRGLDWSTRYNIIKGICDGLHYLHKERHIYHMDLKPANILLNNDMVPKITDFGLSRLDEKSQTLTVDRCGTPGYCAPEYLCGGKMSFKSDIYSLGIIITELVTGEKSIPCDNKNNVFRRWRHRWRKSGKETPLVYQQVAKCMEIGLLCQKIDPSKRPFIWDLIHHIREMDAVDGPISNAYEYKFGQISPYSEDDMLGVEPLELHFPFELNKQISTSLKLTNQTDAYIAFNIQNMSPLGYCTQPTKGIVPPWAKCSVDVTLGPQDKAPRDMQRANEFTVWSTKVNDGLAAGDITVNMFSPESGVVDTMNLDVVFDAEESTKVSKELTLHSITEDMSNLTTDCTLGNVMESPEFELPLRTSSTGSQNHQEAAKESSEVIAGSSMILDVHPLELRFRFEPNKLVACSLDLTNNTDEKVAFGLLKKSDGPTCFLTKLPMFGFVDPRTKYTFVVILDKHENQPQERNFDLILQTSTYNETRSSKWYALEIASMKHFQEADKLPNRVHKVTLKGVCALQGETIFEHSILPSIKINYMEKNADIDIIDANQTEPLIITCGVSRGVHIWNYDTQKLVGSIEREDRNSAWCVKFIARKGWFLVGTENGFIHVYKYKKEMQKITSISVRARYVYSLAIHPTQPYVLSACDDEIRLWDLGHNWFGWKCMQTFKEHSSGGVRAVAFNPDDYNSFASASDDKTIKVWSLDSPKSKYTLSGHSNSVRSLDFFTRDGQQYLISGSSDNTAKIWDMQKKECVRTLPHKSSINSAVHHRKLPLIVTVRADGRVCLWSSISFRLKRIIHIGSFGFSPLLSFACLNDESGRFAVAHWNVLSVIEISDEEEQGDAAGTTRIPYRQQIWKSETNQGENMDAVA